MSDDRDNTPHASLAPVPPRSAGTVLHLPSLAGVAPLARVGLVGLIVVLTYLRLPASEWKEWLTFAGGLLAGLSIPLRKASDD